MGESVTIVTLAPEGSAALSLAASAGVETLIFRPDTPANASFPIVKPSAIAPVMVTVLRALQPLKVLAPMEVRGSVFSTVTVVRAEQPIKALPPERV